MTTHLSTRLAWHDRAWDGHVCDNPGKNAYCIVQPHIRDGRDDEREMAAAGRPLSSLDGWQPPCSRDPIAFSKLGYTITHQDPLEFRQLPSVQEDIPPYSVCPSPYRWMREENFRDICEDEKLDIRASDTPDKESGWVFEPDRQLALLANFWGKLEAPKTKNSVVAGIEDVNRRRRRRAVHGDTGRVIDIVSGDGPGRGFAPLSLSEHLQDGGLLALKVDLLRNEPSSRLLKRQ